MNCTCNCIAFIQMITKILSTFVRPPSVRCLGTTHSFAFSTFPVVPATFFANGMTTQCCQPWESRVCVCVCVCVGGPSVYMKPSSTFSTCFVLSGKCFANGMTTLWSMLLTWATICCMLEGWKPYTHLHSGSWREKKELQWHFKQTVTLQFRYMSLLPY